jgi:hypothetical protein
LTGIQSIYILLFTLILCKFRFQYIGKAFVFLILILFTAHAGMQIQKNFSANDYGGVAKIQGKLDAVEYVYNDAGRKDFGLLIFTPPVHTFAYDYLIWWKGEREYGFVPQAKKEGRFYLLMEPDPHQPWSYKGWMETVVKTGKVIKTVTLPSGIIVQERYAEKDLEK